MTSTLQSKYVPELCCEHEWERINPEHGIGELCDHCGAHCTRGADGQIETYAAAVAYNGGRQ